MKIAKRALTIFAALLIITTIQAHDLGSVMKEHAQTKEIKYSRINKAMIRIGGMVTNRQTRAILKKISNIQMVTAEKEANTTQLLIDVDQIIERDKYEMLAEFVQEGNHFKIYHKEHNSKEAELLTVLHNEDGTLQVVLIEGSLTMEEMMKLQGVEEQAGDI